MAHALKVFGRTSNLPNVIAYERSTDRSGRLIYGAYRPSERRVMLSDKLLAKSPGEAFTTAVHEMTHCEDHVRGNVADDVFKQSLRELGIRKNSKQCDSLIAEIVGIRNFRTINTPDEYLAYSAEKDAIKRGNSLSMKMLEILRKAVKKNGI